MTHRQEQLEEMRLEMLEDQLHEKNMRDPEYFIEYIINNLTFEANTLLGDIPQKVHEACLEADNDVTAHDVFEYMKGM